MYRTVSCSGLLTTWSCWSESSQGTGSKWTETSALIEEAGRAGAGQPGGKKAQGSLIHVHKYPTAVLFSDRRKGRGHILKSNLNIKKTI